MNLDDFENEIETAVTEPDSDEKTEWLTALIAQIKDVDWSPKAKPLADSLIARAESVVRRIEPDRD